jgi:hypothetical protein
LLLTWQEEQGTPACKLERGKPVALWSKTPADQVVIVWQVAQAEEVVGKPAVTWFGEVVVWNTAWWQP